MKDESFNLRFVAFATIPKKGIVVKMITLQKENVQKIVASKAQVEKLVQAGFKVVKEKVEEKEEKILPPPVQPSTTVVEVVEGVVEEKAEKPLTASEKKALAKADAESKKAEAGDENEPTGADTDGDQNGAEAQ